MNETKEAACPCNSCPGAGCTCGCQKSAQPGACACGPQCRCGEACACAAK